MRVRVLMLSHTAVHGGGRRPDERAAGSDVRDPKRRHLAVSTVVAAARRMVLGGGVPQGLRVVEQAARAGPVPAANAPRCASPSACTVTPIERSVNGAAISEPGKAGSGNARPDVCVGSCPKPAQRTTPRARASRWAPRDVDAAQTAGRASRCRGLARACSRPRFCLPCGASGARPTPGPRRGRREIRLGFAEAADRSAPPWPGARAFPCSHRCAPRASASYAFISSGMCAPASGGVCRARLGVEATAKGVVV